MKSNTKSIRVGLAQMNPTVGDLDGNLRKIRATVTAAKRLGVQLLAFPEMMICGYPPEDLLLKPRFLADCETALEAAARSARGIAVVVGSPEPPERRGGRPFNTSCVLLGGRVAARYRKINLPNYGVFDEKRHFEAGDRAVVVNFGGAAIGLSICEDVWVDDGPSALQVHRGGARIIVNISASPYHRRRGLEREKLMQRRARENSCYLCYVNLVGGQDELVFDGGSVIATPGGRTIARGTPFGEDLIVADIPLGDGSSPGGAEPGGGTRGAAGQDRAGRKGGGPAVTGTPDETGGTLELVDLPPLPARGPRPAVRRRSASHLKPDAEVYEALVLGTRDYVEKNGFRGVILGISGGIDSALAAAIAVDAIGTGRVTGVTMPSRYTSSVTLRDSRLLAEGLGIRLYELPIAGILDGYLAALREASVRVGMDVTEENLQARIRGNLLMALSNRYGWLVLATGNKSEVAVGYCTLYGDMAGGFSILKDVPKTLVYTLSRYRNRIAKKAIIPRSIIRRTPSAELRPDQTDQDTLPPYPVLDRIIELYVERDMAFGEIAASGIDPGTARRTIRMIDSNEYKRRQGAPGLKITPKAFGRDRRLPITNRYRGAGKDRGA
jgi:NAD+ synthase (glutamine-hydrolysing)